MNLSCLTNSRPPEYYNQQYWLCLKQRNAWLLQRWLQKSDAFFYYLKMNAQVFISDETELEKLFLDTEKYAVRFVEETYWIIWKVKGYYFVLSFDRFCDSSQITERFLSTEFDSEYLEKITASVQHVLIILYKKHDMPNIKRVKSVSRIANCQAVFSELENNGNINFFTKNRQYSIDVKSLLNWYEQNGTLKT